jgi:HD-GYP domain-containing protein (c-di-GMP phosphodiesterase class II)
MKPEQPTAPSHRHSLHSRAKALGVILASEFGVPFRLFDADGGQELPLDAEDGGGGRWEFEAEFVRQIAREGLCRARHLDDHHNHLTLVIFDAAPSRTGLPAGSAGPGAALVAFGVLRSLAGPGAERPRELEQLGKWLQTFSDRLRLNDLYVSHRRAAEDQAAQLKRAWEMILALDDALRHVRVYKDPEKNRKLILRAARTFLEVQCVIWVPARAGMPPLIEGDSCLALADCRQLGELLSRHADGEPRKPVLWNADAAEIWSTRFPQLRNVLAFVVQDAGSKGWLIAANKQGPAGEAATARPADDARLPFRRTDAAGFAPFAALLETQLRGYRRYQELKGLLVGLTRSLTSALDAKDAYTFGHSERVARIAVELGDELGLQEEELNDIYLSGLLHDIGKIGVPDALLTKAGPLDEAETERLRQHVTIGYQILADLQPLRNLLPGVLYHHERVDGRGYPEGLAGENIPVLARIIAVADAFDAMSTQRSYRQALPAAEVEAILKKGAGTQWDPRVIDAFFRIRERINAIRQRGVGQSLCQALETALRTGDSSRCHPVLGAPAVVR